MCVFKHCLFCHPLKNQLITYITQSMISLLYKYSLAPKYNLEAKLLIRNLKIGK